MKDIKLKLLLTGTIIPIVGFFLMFVNPFFGIGLFILSALAYVLVFILIIVDRIKEKEEDEKRDYSNY